MTLSAAYSSSRGTPAPRVSGWLPSHAPQRSAELAALGAAADVLAAGPKQQRRAPLRAAREAEVVGCLWSGSDSVARRMVEALASHNRSRAAGGTPQGAALRLATEA